MPIYEYQCGACGHNLEALQKINESPLTECPACGKRSLQKCISATSFRLKGNGWYVTDFKDKGTPSTQTDKQTTADKDASPSNTKQTVNKDSQSATTAADQ